MSSLPSPSLFANPFLGHATYKRKEEKGVLVFISLQGRFSNPGRSLTPGTAPWKMLSFSLGLWKCSPNYSYLLWSGDTEQEGVCRPFAWNE